MKKISSKYLSILTTVIITLGLFNSGCLNSKKFSLRQSKTERINILEEKVESLSYNIGSLTTENSELKKGLVDLETVKNQLDKEYTQIVDKQNALEAAQTSQSEARRRLADELAETKDMLEKVKQQLTVVEQDKNGLREKLEKLEASRAEPAEAVAATTTADDKEKGIADENRDDMTQEKQKTVLVEGAGDKTVIQKRVAMLHAQAEQTDSEYDKKDIQKRIGKLSGGVAVINVGAATETELKEKKARVDDALHATRAAVEEGVVVGGGITSFRAISSLASVTGENADQNTGIAIVKRALEEPLRQIAANAGKDGGVIVERLTNAAYNIGYNARTDEICDLFAAGVIDPTKVCRSALQNAASIAGMILTTEALVGDLPEEKKAPMPSMGGMGGMPGMGMM